MLKRHGIKVLLNAAQLQAEFACLAFGFVLSNALQVMPGTGNAVSVSRRKQTRLRPASPVSSNHRRPRLCPWPE